MLIAPNQIDFLGSRIDDLLLKVTTTSQANKDLRLQINTLNARLREMHSNNEETKTLCEHEKTDIINLIKLEKDAKNTQL